MTDLAAMRAKGVAKFAVTPPDERKKRRFLLALCGGAIGVVNGLFGAGGGMLAVPVLAFAAGVCAKYSAGKGEKIPVDHCPVRRVKKPSGSKPGFVTYTDFGTVLGDPALAEET